MRAAGGIAAGLEHSHLSDLSDSDRLRLPAGRLCQLVSGLVNHGLFVTTYEDGAEWLTLPGDEGHGKRVPAENAQDLNEVIERFGFKCNCGHKGNSGFEAGFSGLRSFRDPRLLLVMLTLSIPSSIRGKNRSRSSRGDLLC